MIRFFGIRLRQHGLQIVLVIFGLFFLIYLRVTSRDVNHKKQLVEQLDQIEIIPFRIADSLSINEESSKYVTIINVSSDTIIIDQFMTQCPCTKVVADSFTIYPKDTLMVNVKFKPYGIGIFEQPVRIITNDLDQPYFIFCNYYVY